MPLERVHHAIEAITYYRKFIYTKNCFLTVTSLCYTERKNTKMTSATVDHQRFTAVFITQDSVYHTLSSTSAPHWQCGGQRFKSAMLHHIGSTHCIFNALRACKKFLHVSYTFCRKNHWKYTTRNDDYINHDVVVFSYTNITPNKTKNVPFM